ncbi:MAG: cupin domain-containing protein [Shinella sp.]|nr:MAG: cupin domain-containing protein [Shinella sp.]
MMDRGDVLILKPEDGKNFWQPVPANGHISVRISPDFVNVETPFSIGTQTLPPQGYVREHAHPVHDEVLHFISGQGIALVDGVEYPAVPGTTIFVGRNRKHKFINTSTDQELHWLWFIQPNGLEHFFEEIGRPMRPGEDAPEPFARPDNILEIEQRTAFVAPDKL